MHHVALDAGLEAYAGGEKFSTAKSSTTPLSKVVRRRWGLQREVLKPLVASASKGVYGDGRTKEMCAIWTPLVSIPAIFRMHGPWVALQSRDLTLYGERGV